jgi:UDP-GlcNAc3NAcA epimerase
VGADKKKILDGIRNFQPKQKQRNLFGNGHAGEKIATIVKQFLSS